MNAGCSFRAPTILRPSGDGRRASTEPTGAGNRRPRGCGAIAGEAGVGLLDGPGGGKPTRRYRCSPVCHKLSPRTATAMQTQLGRTTAPGGSEVRLQGPSLSRLYQQQKVG